MFTRIFIQGIILIAFLRRKKCVKICAVLSTRNRDIICSIHVYVSFKRISNALTISFKSISYSYCEHFSGLILAFLSFDKRAFIRVSRIKYYVACRLPCIIAILRENDIQMVLQYDQKTCVQRAIAIIALESIQISFSLRIG